MQKAHWRLQDAKARFSQVVDAAMNGEPQHVTKRGHDAVVILSETSYRALKKNARAGAPSFLAHLLDIPKSMSAAVERCDIRLREADL